jgi:hypothetical protein
MQFLADSPHSLFFNERKPSKLEEEQENGFSLLDYPWENDANSGGDAGDFIGVPTPIIAGNYNGTINDDVEDKDYYSFQAEKGTIINITMIAWNSTRNFDLTLFASGGSELASDHRDAGVQEKIIYSTVSTANYTFLIAPGVIGHKGNYTFTLTLAKQNDFGTNNDGGNNINTPLRINSGGEGNGLLVDGSDDNDFYIINLEQGDVLDFQMVSVNTTNIDLFLYDNLGTELKRTDKLVGFNESINYAISETDDYILGIQLVDIIDESIIIPYNLSIQIVSQDDGNSNTDAGNTAEDAFFIIPLSSSVFQGKLYANGDTKDFYTFTTRNPAIIYINLFLDASVNFDLVMFDFSKREIYASRNTLQGAQESISGEYLDNGTYYILVEYIDPLEGESGTYSLNVGLIPEVIQTTDPPVDIERIILLIISSVIVPISILIIIILVLYLFTDIRVPWISNRLDRYFSKEGKAESIRSLKYALRVRDENINDLRDELIEKDSKRAKDLETIHRLEEDIKSKEKVLTTLREENTDLKTRLANLEEVNEDLANIIDSTIRRQLSKTSKSTQKAKTSEITSLLWLSEERLVNYINSIPLLNERYILSKDKNYILTKDYAREIVRQAYWKRIGAMHLKKIKQVKVQNLADDTRINVKTVKEILRELVERKEIPAPIHMDRDSLLLSISEELMAELSELAQNTPVISLEEVSESYDTTFESAKVIFEKIAEEGYVEGEFITKDKFVVLDLLSQKIISEASIKINEFANENKLENEIEEFRILLEKLKQQEKIEGIYLTKNIFLSLTNLSKQLKNLIQKSAEDIKRDETRRMVFDRGSVVESIIKKQLMLDIHEVDDVDKLPRYQNIIESKELGKIIRAAEKLKISLPATVELKTLNRFWAQKIKHTKPGELLYIPSENEAEEFLFDANKILNRFLAQKIPTKWKTQIADYLLGNKK